MHEYDAMTQQQHGDTSVDEQEQYNPITPLPEIAHDTRRLPWRFMAVIASVSVIVVVGAALIPSLTQPMTTTLTLPHPVVVPMDVGMMSFGSSGQLDPTSSTGLNDIVQLSLSDVIPPAPGHRYDGWLLGDAQNGSAPILLGQLAIVGGK